MKRTTDISVAASQLRGGGLVAFPTETVYGLGGDAVNDDAVAAIFKAKGRPQFNPLIVHVATVEAARELVQFNQLANNLAEQFWPGPLTLVVPRSKNCRVSLLASAGLESLAIRVPAHPMAQSLLAEFGGPVVAPSANPSGCISPTSPDHVVAGLDGEIELLLDGGECQVGVESTIISCLKVEPQILRLGGVTRLEIEGAFGKPVQMGEQNAKPPTAPGQLASHYAPNATVRLDVHQPENDEAFLAFGSVQENSVLNLSKTGDLTEAAANLFKMLHQLDDSGAMKIAVSPIPGHGLGEAINDRLRRAATPRENV